jgi:succinate dehydrogenase / fumarate reductase iron-sulfur subunit
MAGNEVRMRIWRGDSAGGDFVDFDVDANEGEVVLDVVHRVQASQAGDLAVRWNCKAGKCGSCSAEINGWPRLLCMTRMSIFEPGETVTVAPLRTFPVVRDLVTDVSFNYEVAKHVPPFTPKPREKDGTYRMQQVDVERGQEFRKCIECWLCQNTCHVIRDHEENKPQFAGPRFFIRYAELDMHPLDTLDRRKVSQAQAGLGLCNITKCCTEVCPEHIKITDNGIIPMKERVVDRKHDPLFTITSLWRQPGREEVPVEPGAGVGWSGRPKPPDEDGMYVRTLDVEPAPAAGARPESAAAAPSADGGSRGDGARPDATAAGEPADQRETR